MESIRAIRCITKTCCTPNFLLIINRPWEREWTSCILLTIYHTVVLVWKYSLYIVVKWCYLVYSCGILGAYFECFRREYVYYIVRMARQCLSLVIWTSNVHQEEETSMMNYMFTLVPVRLPCPDNKATLPPSIHHQMSKTLTKPSHRSWLAGFRV